MKYLVQYDFTKYQPDWNRDCIEVFGAENEGFEIEGPDPKTAFELWNMSQLPGNRINRFYVKITQII